MSNPAAVQLEAHIADGKTLDPEDEDGRLDWLQRTKSLLRVIGAHDDLMTSLNELEWAYYPMVYVDGQDRSGWPARSRQIRADSMREAIRIASAALDEHTLVYGSGGQAQSSSEFGGAVEVFIVHGHDHALRAEVASFLSSVLGRHPIVFDKEPSAGSETVIEKLERLGERAGFAVVLMTPDDDVGDSEKRARQNVLIELGWFSGRLGRDRVRIIRHPDAQMPSDLGGILYTTTQGNWQTELGRDLKAAGLEIDMNAVL